MTESTPELPFVDHPADGVPEVIDTPAALDDLVASLRAGSGPIAFDVERAHGHRYHPKAYLFQLRRAGTGTALVDPVAFEVDGTTDLSVLVDAVGDEDWIVHAASQDLPSMIDDAVVPARVFDTELAARLLNYPQVGLAALVERHCGVRLRKAHSAADWSRRPLPTDWLNYAALDVEFLIDLRDVLVAELAESGKTEWARQEFEHTIRAAQAPPAPCEERWRRLSGLRDVRSRRGLAVARALWFERDEIAASLDRPVGRLLPDQGITTLAATIADNGPLPGPAQLRGVTEFTYRGARRFQSNWLRAIQGVAGSPASSWPPKRPPKLDIGQPKSWVYKNPDAFERWKVARPAVDEVAEQHDVPPAQLIQPAALREIVFAHPAVDDIESALVGLGVRPWQIELVSPVLRRTWLQEAEQADH